MKHFYIYCRNIRTTLHLVIVMLNTALTGYCILIIENCIFSHIYIFLYTIYINIPVKGINIHYIYMLTNIHYIYMLYIHVIYIYNYKYLI